MLGNDNIHPLHIRVLIIESWITFRPSTCYFNLRDKNCWDHVNICCSPQVAHVGNSIEYLVFSNMCTQFRALVVVYRVTLVVHMVITRQGQELNSITLTHIDSNQKSSWAYSFITSPVLDDYNCIKSYLGIPLNHCKEGSHWSWLNFDKAHGISTSECQEIIVVCKVSCDCNCVQSIVIVFVCKVTLTMYLFTAERSRITYPFDSSCIAQRLHWLFCS